MKQYSASLGLKRQGSSQRLIMPKASRSQIQLERNASTLLTQV
ncbi:hypothetical protein [Deefgea sp. CFH1-16]|nr:hypothetical protein [Deefgea sp. CFH1-16]